jgi:hypothetical protein
MNRLRLIILNLLYVSAAVSQSNALKYQETITESDLKKHLTYIASDELEGRDTGSEGQKKAGQYIINYLEEYGLKPIVKSEDGSLSYYQRFNVYKNGWKESYITINGKRKTFFKDFFPVGMVNIPIEKTIETVFVDYGMVNDTRNDYKNKNVKGKAIVFIENAPKNASDYTVWEGNEGLKKKQKIATEYGASFVFVVSLSEASQFKTLSAERKAVLSRYNRMVIDKPKAETESNLPSFVISETMAAEMLGLKSKTLRLYLNGKLNSIATKKTTLKIKSERGADQIETANIMGFLEGTDKKDEVIIISAHYDHVGIDDKGQIYNGADDDGSGTCSILELAQAYSIAKAEGNGPRRSILFLWVTGEEKGLLGSKYYTDIDPIIPLKNTICDLNIDMVGRVDKKHEANPNYVYLIGSDKLSSELHEISEKTNIETINFELDYEFNDPKDPNRFYYRSDHYNFAKNKIPVIFYFTGVHEDYHKPGDDVEKILFPKYTKIVQLVFKTSWNLANRENKIVVDSNKP